MLYLSFMGKYMGNIKRRIEKLENHEEEEEIPEKLITLFMKLRNLPEKYGLGPNPTREEIIASFRRMSSHSKLH